VDAARAAGISNLDTILLIDDQGHFTQHAELVTRTSNGFKDLSVTAPDSLDQTAWALFAYANQIDISKVDFQHQHVANILIDATGKVRISTSFQDASAIDFITSDVNKTTTWTDTMELGVQKDLLAAGIVLKGQTLQFIDVARQGVLII